MTASGTREAPSTDQLQIRETIATPSPSDGRAREVGEVAAIGVEFGPHHCSTPNRRLSKGGRR